MLSIFLSFQADMDSLYTEMMSAEDKLASTLYNLQSNESIYAHNILGKLRLKVFTYLLLIKIAFIN